MVRWTKPQYLMDRLGIEVYNSTRNLRRAAPSPDAQYQPPYRPPIWFLAEKPELKKAGCPLGEVGLILADSCLSKFYPTSGGNFPPTFIRSGDTYEVRLLVYYDNPRLPELGGDRVYAERWESQVYRVTLGSPSTTPNPTSTPEPTRTPVPTPTIPAVIPTATPTPIGYRNPTPAPPFDLGNMIARVRPAIVKVKAGGQGSGVIYRTDSTHAYIVTNQHVVDYRETVTITVRDTRDIKGAVLGVDDKRDLAVIKIPCTDCTAIDFGDSEDLRQGDTVVAVGYPMDDVQPRDASPRAAAKRVIPPSTITVTTGVVSAFRYDSEFDRQLIQTDAAVNPGNSGGPLLTVYGKIVGINTFGIWQSQGLNYAVMETTVQTHLETLESGNLPKLTPTPPPPVWRTVAGPLAGHMHHDPGHGVIRHVTSHVDIEDSAARAWICNPETKPFDYGFSIRVNADDPFLVFIVHSDGDWGLYKGTDTPYQTLARGKVPNLDTNPNRCNYLIASVLGESGTFSVNGDDLVATSGKSTIDLGTGMSSGVTRIITGFLRGTEHAGGITVFEGFEIRAPAISVMTDGDGLPQIPRDWVGDSGAGPRPETGHEPDPAPAPTPTPTNQHNDPPNTPGS